MRTILVFYLERFRKFGCTVLLFALVVTATWFVWRWLPLQPRANLGKCDFAQFAPDSSTLLMLEDHKLRLVETATGRVRASISKSPDWVIYDREWIRGFPASFLHSSISPDIRFLVGQDSDDAWCFWDLATGGEFRRWEAGSRRSPNGFSPDGRLLAVDAREQLQVFHFESGDLELEIPFCWDPVFSPSGKWLAVKTNQDGRELQIWDTARKEEVISFPGAASVLAFAPDGKSVAIAHSRSLVWWDLEMSRPRLVDARLPGLPANLHWTHDGRRLAAVLTRGDITDPASLTTAVKIWDVSTSNHAAILSYDEIVDTWFTSSGNVLVAAGEKQFTLWDVTARPPQRIATLEDNVLRDANHSVLAHYAHQADSYFFSTGEKVIVPFRDVLGDLHPHLASRASDNFVDVAFSRDGRVLAFGGTFGSGPLVC